ncbi:MAG: isochorismatase family protein [Roseitalea sp.]|nr:isochorismatase family protein [Roseitalea sp.]MBO6721151.1 isochorismatase family protein [Roseitalea sp.]MBO6744209.1 isochorismatase family protein [Roseitalea sp.]
MADPSRSQILLIEPVPRQLDALDPSLAHQLSVSFEQLSEAADCVFVPRFFAVTDDDGSRDTWLSKPCERNRSRVFQFRTESTVLSNTKLLDALRKEEREQLFICGFWLDDTVASTALELLMLGFNAHIIIDLSLAYDRAQRGPALDRCNQYGVVPISFLSLLYEWLTHSDNDESRTSLIKLWEAQKDLERRGASA